jgi:hypothetical protein
MVQFKAVDTTYRGKLRRIICSTKDNYWKLGLYRCSEFTVQELIKYLQKRGYHCRANISRPHVIDAVGRYQRGLMSYDGLSVAELQTFCKAKGLPSKATTASRLARALEKADDLATFPKFFDLPAELRNIIYELFFRSLRNFDDKHVQPPLTMASRQFRAESLPLFYECATFDMFAQSYPGRSTDVDIRPCTKALMYMPAANFKRIKTFDLFWSTHPNKRGRGNGHKVVKIVVRMTDEDVPEDPEFCYLEELGPKIVECLIQDFWNIETSLREQEESTEALEMRMDGSLFNDMEGRWKIGGDQAKAGALVLRTLAE